MNTKRWISLTNNLIKIKKYFEFVNFSSNLTTLTSAGIIRGNRANCAKFSKHLDWLINQLDARQNASAGILAVVSAVLDDSTEVLNMVKESHIISIISLLERHGRNPLVLD